MEHVEAQSVKRTRTRKSAATVPSNLTAHPKAISRGLLTHSQPDRDSLNIHKSGSTLDANHCTSMATGRNRFSVVAEHNSSLPCKTAAPVSPTESYQEFPELFNNFLPFSRNLPSFVRIPKSR